jgi:hypothetical protein
MRIRDYLSRRRTPEAQNLTIDGLHASIGVGPAAGCAGGGPPLVSLE